MNNTTINTVEANDDEQTVPHNQQPTKYMFRSKVEPNFGNSHFFISSCRVRTALGENIRAVWTSYLYSNDPYITVQLTRGIAERTLRPFTSQQATPLKTVRKQELRPISNTNVEEAMRFEHST